MLGLVTLKDDVLLGPSVQIPSGPMTHGFERMDIPMRLQQGTKKRITVATDSWIGTQSIVLADIGDHTVIGAGSVVTKVVSSAVIAAGNPAKPIRRRVAQS